jgi:hypothetical protein
MKKWHGEKNSCISNVEKGKNNTRGIPFGCKDNKRKTTNTQTKEMECNLSVIFCFFLGHTDLGSLPLALGPPPNQKFKN